MTTLCLIFGLLNLTIGLGLAVAVERPHLLGSLLPRGRRGSAEPQPAHATTGETAHSPTEAATTSEKAEPGIGALPSHWSESDNFTATKPGTFDEAMLWLILSEADKFRQRLLASDAACRGDAATELPLADLKAASQTWQEKLTAWTSEAAGCCSSRATAGLRLELDDLLANYQSRIKSAMETIASMTAQPQSDDAKQSVSQDMRQLSDATGTLREQAVELLILILREQQQLRSLPDSARTDEASATISRLGAECIFDDWLGWDPERNRSLSGVLLNVDRMSNINEQISLEAANKTLAAIGRMLKTLVRQHRGFDRVARISGQEYLLILGDTTVLHAMYAAERIRQAVEATSLRAGGRIIECTVRCGVAELGRTETTAGLLSRLRKLAAEAKKAGGNRTCYEDGGHTQLADISSYLVRTRVLEVEEMVAATAS